MQPCLSQATTMSATFEEDVRAFAAVGCSAMEVWLTKLEAYVADRTPEETKRLFAEHNVAPRAAAMQGGLVQSQGESRRESFALFERRLALCESVGIPRMIVAGDFAGAVTREEYDRGIVSLRQAGRLAAARGVSLALEFQSHAAFCNNLNTAIALVEECGEPNIGICLDVFHYYTGPSKFEDLATIPPHRLVHVQLSDLAGTPRELAGDSDRVLPGDGDFLIEPIIDHLRAIGYTGCMSVELMNPQIWQLEPVQVAEVAMTALRKLLRLAG